MTDTTARLWLVTGRVGSASASPQEWVGACIGLLDRVARAMRGQPAPGARRAIARPQDPMLARWWRESEAVLATADRVQRYRDSAWLHVDAALHELDELRRELHAVVSPERLAPLPEVGAARAAAGLRAAPAAFAASRGTARLTGQAAGALRRRSAA